MSRRSLPTYAAAPVIASKRPLDLGPDAWLGLASARARPGRLGGAGEVKEVLAIGVVELERPGQCLQHAFGGALMSPRSRRV